MNESPHENELDLEQLLDIAAQRWQPNHPGWETLVERLPAQQASDVARRSGSTEYEYGRRSTWLWVAVSACVLAAGLLSIVITSGPSLAQTLPVEVVRQGVEVTVFNATKSHEPTLYSPVQQQTLRFATGGAGQTNPAAGLMLVRDRRMVLHLRAGDNIVRFTDVAASIDPTSVLLVSDTDPLGTRVVEQNFEFDLASADGILRRSIEKEVTCIGAAGGEPTTGYLLSFDDRSLILADRLPRDDPSAARPRTETIARGTLTAIQISQLPRDLHTRPTLVWTLRTGKPGDHHTTLTYLCGHAVWRADYVAAFKQLDGPQAQLDLTGWVTLDNRSGASYENARLKLIAGDVSRVRDPWSEVRVQLGVSLGRETMSFRGIQRLAGKGPQFLQQDFFEYKLYTLSQPSTVRDQQIKQLQLLHVSGIKARIRLLCRSVEGANLHPELRLQIENKKENELGRPIPAGKIAVMARDRDGDLQLVRRVEIDHTATDEKININAGSAHDVLYGYRVVDTQRLSENHIVETCEFRVRSHKAQPADVRLIGRLRNRRNAHVSQANAPHTRYDYRTLHFDFMLPPNAEKVVTYKVEYQW